MPKFICLSLLSLIIHCAFAQNIHSKKADSLYAAKNFAIAGKYYMLAAGTAEFKAFET